MPTLLSSRRPFSNLSEEEVLALAISAEEEDGRIYANYATRLRSDYPQSAKVFDGMTEEENTHRIRLIERFKERFGPNIPLIRREHVSGFYPRKPYWLAEHLGIERVRAEVALMEKQAHLFYVKAAGQTRDADTRRLLGDLAQAEIGHITAAEKLEAEHFTSDAMERENAVAHREFVLTYVQPGLAGLMDGSVSTLAPIFAAAFATHQTWQTFLVGLAASVGAGISMGFTEAASDDGSVSGRGAPWKRGLACGIMTTLGGLGHALPYLVPHFWIATSAAFVIVAFELWAIAWIQNRYMDTPFWRAALQVVLGGSLVFAAGVLIGSA